MFELTGGMDDMTSEVSVHSGSIFPLVTADTNKSGAHDRVAAAGSRSLKVLFLFSFQETL